MKDAKQNFPVVALFITAAIWAGFGVWLGSNPNALLDAFGIGQTTPQMATELRAFYGGVELAIACVMIILWARSEIAAALIVGGVPLLFSASGRMLGLMVDGYYSLHIMMAGLEVFGAAFCFGGVVLLVGDKNPLSKRK